MRNIDKFRGCLIGGAAGDALGYEVEFDSEEEIRSRFGKDGITAYVRRDGLALISDDTQMTLFTAEGLLLSNGSAADSVNSIRQMYLDWYRTQNEAYPLPDASESRLLSTPELFSRRKPGTTCLNALAGGARGSVASPLNNSKGCGGVMRVAPIGLFFAESGTSYEVSDMLAAEAAALTHGHDLGYIPAAALVHIVRAAVENVTLKDAVNDAIAAMEKLFPNAAHIADFTVIMRKAVQLAETETDDLSAIHQLGEGWVAEETLAIAVYCALKYRNDFDKALRKAVNHKGDSDSTGAVCGNILGTYVVDE